MSRYLGEVVVELMERQDGGQLPADALHELADGLVAVVDELRTRAEEIVLEQRDEPPVVVIEGGLIHPG